LIAAAHRATMKRARVVGRDSETQIDKTRQGGAGLSDRPVGKLRYQICRGQARVGQQPEVDLFLLRDKAETFEHQQNPSLPHRGDCC